MRKRRKKILKKHYSKAKILFSLFILQASFIIFNDAGLIHLIKLKNKKENLKSQINVLLNQQINLQDEIIQLTSDEQYIEQVARERFMMVKPGEKVFRVIDHKEVK